MVWLENWTEPRSGGQPANPGNETDDTNLSAINGFSLTEPALDESLRRLRLLTRHRRDVVRKTSTRLFWDFSRTNQK